MPTIDESSPLRLLRKSWGSPDELAQELFSLLSRRSEPERPSPPPPRPKQVTPDRRPAPDPPARRGDTFRFGQDGPRSQSRTPAQDEGTEDRARSQAPPEAERPRPQPSTNDPVRARDGFSFTDPARLRGGDLFTDPARVRQAALPVAPSFQSYSSPLADDPPKRFTYAFAQPDERPRQAARADSAFEWPELRIPDYPGGGGNTTISYGKVTGGGGQTVTILPLSNGSTNGTDADEITVFIANLDPSDKLAVGTLVGPIYQFTDDQGQSFYEALVPVWQENA